MYGYANAGPLYWSLAQCIGFETALQYGMRDGKEDLVTLLLERGANRDPRSPIKKMAALEIAKAKGFDHIARLLREA